MRIKKIYQGELPENKIVNEKIDSQTDTYSCDYINNLSFEGGNGVDELPIDSIIEYEGETVPDGWELVEDGDIDSGYTPSLISINEGGEKTYTIGNWAWTNFEFTNVKKILGDGFEYDTENYKINILKDMTIRADAQISYYTTVNGELNIRILKNGGTSDNAISYVNRYDTFNDKPGTLNITGCIDEVKAGDVLEFQFSGVAGSYGINQRHFLSHLTIEEVVDIVPVIAGDVVVESGERNYIQCEMTDRVNVPDSNYVLLPFNNNYIMGNGFTYDSETNEVVIDPKSNIDKVKIHFHAVMAAGGEKPVTALEVLVYKNDEIALIGNESFELGSSRTSVSVDRVVECAPGDRFRVEIKSYDNIFILLNTYGRTVFSLEDMTNVTVNNVTVEGTIEAKEVSYAQMRTNDTMSFAAEQVEIVNVWSDTFVENGKFRCEPANNRIVIPAGSAEYVEIYGGTAGSGYCQATVRLMDDEGATWNEVHSLFQYGGNKYFCSSIGSKIVKIPDMTKDYYVKLTAGSYREPFTLNMGFGNAATYMGVREVSNTTTNYVKTEMENYSTITVCSATDTAETSVYGWENVPLDTVRTQTGDRLTMTNNGVLIGPGVSYVRVSGYGIGTFKNANSTAYDYMLAIRKNEDHIMFNRVPLNANTNVINQVISIPSMTIPVVEGDMIYLSSYTTSSRVARSIKANSTLTVEVAGDMVKTEIIEHTGSENYSTEETVIGTWINNKPIYRKVIDLGSLPDKSSINVATGLTHTQIRLVKLYGVATTSDGLYQAGLNDTVSRLNLVEDNTIVLATNANFSSFTGYAILEYTKTTD